MLVIKVELWPGGNELRARELGRVGVANVSQLRDLSNYVAVASDDREGERETFVKGHPREAGFWRLVELVARSLATGRLTPTPERHKETAKSVKHHMWSA